VREGEDLLTRNVGRLLRASSVFPYFTDPVLHTRVACAPSAMDGYFPGRGSSILPVPDLAFPGVGSTILVDMSGGLREAYADDSRVWVLSLQDWRTFGVEDWTASSTKEFRRLFATGVRDAGEHWAELDRVMREAFGVRPLSMRPTMGPQ